MKDGQPQFHTVLMQPEHAAEICTWFYPPPYDIYGWLPWEQMVQLGVEFGDPSIREQQYVSVVDEKEQLWGFAQLFPMEGVIRLGIGMRPDYCGHGMGQRFMEAVVSEAKSRDPTAEIDLEVLTWNERAIRAYRKAGFAITDSYERMTPTGMAPFYCMVHSPSSSG